MSGPRSRELFERARQLIPGGVNSPARAFGPVGGSPPFIRSGSGSGIVDADGRSYVDYVCSWGPLILGHADPGVVAAVNAATASGTSFGAPTEIEVTMAELITERIPSVEMVRMVNSGTEATMSAVRLARGVTGRKKIIKFEGCWHGHGDSFLVKAGSSALSQGVPDSPGVPEEIALLSVSVAYNDLEAVRRAADENAEDVAAVIVEPVAGNMGVVPPAPGFLEGLRDLCSDAGIVLIFDEVITGFRVAPGGAQELYGVMPDLTCLGKIIGGGFPVGAYGGRRELMQNVSPLGIKVSQAGTLSGNPVAMTAGCEMLKRLSDPEIYARIERSASALTGAMRQSIADGGYAACVQRVGSMFTLFFNAGPVRNGTDAAACDTKRFAVYFHAMQEEGVYIPPSQYESWFVSAAHTDEDIALTIAANERALAKAFA